MNRYQSTLPPIRFSIPIRRPLFLLFGLYVLLLVIFYPRAYAQDPVFPQGSYYDVTVRGWLETYQPREDQVTLTLRDCQISYKEAVYSCAQLQISASEEVLTGLPPLRAGNELSVTGSLSSFQTARNPGNFDPYAYYTAHHISYRVNAKHIRVTDPQVAPLRELLLQGHQAMAARLVKLSCSPGIASADSDSFSGILQALLLGDKGSLDEETSSRYETGGILHILSVSGLHVSLLGGALLIFTRRLSLPLWLQKLSASLLIVLYWQFCGASLSAGRATIMFLCLSAAPLLGRTYDSLSALSLAGLMLLGFSPGLLFQASFQLSFGAILGILLVCPAFCPPKTAPGKNTLYSVLAFSLGLQLTLLPVTLYHFFRYPLYGILLNLVVLPLTTPLFLCGMTGLLVSFLCLPLGAVLLLPCRLILLLYDSLCQTASALPLSSWLLGRPAPFRILLYYGLLTLFCLYRQKSRQIRMPGDAGQTNSPARPTIRPLRSALTMLSFTALLLSALLLPLPSRALTITFLDTGQGDCAFLLTPKGTSILIDGGSSDIRNAADNRLIPFLEAQAIDSLDYVFLSHSDDDHVNAVTGWLESGHGIGCLILPALRSQLSAEESYQALLSMADAYRIPLLYFSEGAVWSEGDLTLSCLAPAEPDSPEGATYTSLNASSQVLLAEYQDIRILFTGDCGAEGEDMLVQKLQQENLTCQILKTGHHGSATSTGLPLLEQIKPQLAIISCGIHNRYGHPHPNTLARLDEQAIPYYVTADCGAITVTVRSHTSHIQTMLPQEK